MSRHDLAFLVVRLVAIYAGLQAFQFFSSGEYVYDMTMASVGGRPTWEILLQLAMPLIVTLVLSACLFLKTAKIARWLLPADAEPSTTDRGVIQISPSLAFGVLGIVGLQHTLPSLVDWAADLAQAADSDEERGTPWHGALPMVATTVELLMSLTLIFRAHALAQWWKARDHSRQENTDASAPTA